MPKIDDMHAPYILPITPSDADVQYFGVIKDILDEQQSTSKVDRTGVGTQGVFGRQMRFDISNKKLPLLTSKKVFTKGIVHELLWMLSGDTNVQYLNAHGVSIWNSWVKPETAQYRRATWDDWFAIIRRRKLEPSFVFMLREHLSEAEILHFHIKGEFPWAGQDVGDDHPAVNAILKWMKDHDMPERFLVAGELPKIYQHQWRQWEDTRLVPMDIWVTDDWYQNNGFVLLNEYFDAELGEEIAIVHRKIDQIQKVIDQLKTNPDSRRIIVSAWNAAEIEEMALPPCFIPGSLVSTPDGYKKIETLTEGDVVHSGTGQERRINKVWRTPYKGKILYIRPALVGVPIACTPNHPFLVRNKGWVDAKDLKEGDYLAIPKTKSIKDLEFNYSINHGSSGKQIHRTVKCTNEDYYTFGYFLGNGWASVNENRISFAIPHSKVDEILPRLRKTIKVSRKPGSGDNVSTYMTHSEKWISVFRSFGSGAHNKIIPDWVMTSTMGAKKAFIDGFLAADGYRIDEGRFDICCTSPNIILGLQRLFAEQDHAVGTGFQVRPDKTEIEGRVVNQKNTYHLKSRSGSKSKNNTNVEYDDEYMWVPIRKIFYGDSNTTVYNLDVEEEHTYTVSNIVNHNCHTLFQFYTREMDSSERESWLVTHLGRETMDQYRRELGEVSQANDGDAVCDTVTLHALLDHYKVPRRALSCQLYQR